MKKYFNELSEFYEFNEFYNPKTKEIRKVLYRIESKKILFTPKIKEIEKDVFKLEKNLSKLKKYYDYDDIEYKVIRDVGNWFNLSVDEDDYKPIRINSAFNSNSIEYEKKGDKDKILSIKNILIWSNHI